MKGVSITEYIKDRNNYLPNLDSDGLISFILLNHFIEGKIVGFTNSKDYVYLLKGLPHSASTVTYIDMFVSNPNIHSIDQHVITRTSKETKSLAKIGTKLNPNLLFEQDLTDYRHKFPLSTFLFLLMMLSEEYEINIDWHKKIEGTDLELGYFLIDADGVITNLRDYNANMSTWLKKLKNEFNNKVVNELYNYINSLPCLELTEISLKVRKYLRNTFNTETKDGGFKTINNNNIKNIEKIISFYSKILFNEDFEIQLDLTLMDIYKGDIGLTDITNIDKLKTFSYAIVKANGDNLSYTTNLRKIN